MLKLWRLRALQLNNFSHNLPAAAAVKNIAQDEGIARAKVAQHSASLHAEGRQTFDFRGTRAGRLGELSLNSCNHPSVNASELASFEVRRRCAGC